MSEHEKRRDSDVVGLMTWIMRIGSTLAAVGVIFGAIAFAADTRYAQKTEVQQAVQAPASRPNSSSAAERI